MSSRWTAPTPRAPSAARPYSQQPLEIVRLAATLTCIEQRSNVAFDGAHECHHIVSQPASEGAVHMSGTITRFVFLGIALLLGGCEHRKTTPPATTSSQAGPSQTPPPAAAAVAKQPLTVVDKATPVNVDGVELSRPLTPTEREAVAKVDAERSHHLIEKGDSWYTFFEGPQGQVNSFLGVSPDPAHYQQIKGPLYQVHSAPLSEADKLNGFEYKGTVWAGAAAWRRNVAAESTVNGNKRVTPTKWEPWKSGLPPTGIFGRRVWRKDGEWHVSTSHPEGQSYPPSYGIVLGGTPVEPDGMEIGSVYSPASQPSTVTSHPPSNPSLAEISEPDAIKQSASNLDRIGMAIQVHANMNGGRFPKDLVQLCGRQDLLLTAKEFVSPRTGTVVPSIPPNMDPAARADLIGKIGDYIYVGNGLTTSSSSQMIVAYENPDRVKDGILVLLANSSARFVSYEHIQQAIQEHKISRDLTSDPASFSPLPPMSERAANMRKIGYGVSLYANEHGGKFPRDLAEIYSTQGLYAKNFVIPGSQTKVPIGVTKDSPKGINGINDYIYVGSSMSFLTSSSDTVVAYENLERASGEIYILFGDGHISGFPHTRAKKIIQAGKYVAE